MVEKLTTMFANKSQNSQRKNQIQLRALCVKLCVLYCLKINQDVRKEVTKLTKIKSNTTSCSLCKTLCPLWLKNVSTKFSEVQENIQRKIKLNSVPFM